MVYDAMLAAQTKLATKEAAQFADPAAAAEAWAGNYLQSLRQLAAEVKAKRDEVQAQRSCTSRRMTAQPFPQNSRRRVEDTHPFESQ